MKTKELTRRERQAEQLKKEILEASITVFKQYGYEKATTKKIAREADVSEGTLYYYFENKRDILVTLFKILIEKISLNLVEVSTGKDNIINILSKGMARQYSQINTLPIMTLYLHEARLDPEVHVIFSEVIKSVRESAKSLLGQLEKEGKIRKMNNDNMALLMSLIGIGYMTLFETGDIELTSRPLDKLTDALALILVEGIKPEK